MAKVYAILDRRLINMNRFDADLDFDLQAPIVLPNACVLHEAGWTLFSFDFARAQAVFLDIGADCDLSIAPFSYDQQFAQARRLMRLPFADFIELAKQIKSPGRLVHLFNIGHCGSTLLHHVFNRAGGVWCISEPLFTFDATMRSGDGGGVPLVDLLQAGMRFLQLFPGAVAADVIVVKHFSQTVTQIPVYLAANPAAKALLLYRSGAGWCNSIYHFAQRMGGGLQVPPDERDFKWWIVSGAKPVSALDGIVDMTADDVTFDKLAAVAWVLHLRDDVLQGCRGLPLVPLRYDELNAQPARLIEQVFRQCGIDPSNIPAALLAFDEDAHAGSHTSRAVPALDLGQASMAALEQVFAHSLMRFPADTLLPGTLMP